jgi:hypothetical protein
MSSGTLIGSKVMKWTAGNRKLLYRISLALIPLLVFYGVISQDAAPLWIALVGSVFAPMLALANITPDGRGSLDVPADVDNDIQLDTE